MPCLLISVLFHDGRYHGWLDWPPSPARLFQALVAAAAQGETLAEEDRHAFIWLESLDPPAIASPPMRAGQGFKNFVPNNDRDAVESREFKNHRDYLAALGKIRTSKDIRPILFDAEVPLLYTWTFGAAPEARANAERVCAIAERLYQLGRGVDMAWAWSEILAAEEAEARLAAQGGALHRPSDGAGGTTLAVPLKGSLESLVERHRKMRTRFQTLYESKPSKKEPDRKVAAGQIFVQPPKPRFRQVAYDSRPTRLLFNLVGETASWRLDRIVELTERVRDAAAQRLKDKRPDEADKIRNAVVGRRDADEADKAARVRITPLPSIGHQHADHAIRRILVEIPPNCPLRADDVEWAFSGLLLVSDQGEILRELAAAAERGMLAHYGVEHAAPARLWRTIIPAALPQQAARRRIDPARRRAEAKGGAERAEEQGKAVSAVIQALRHVGVLARPLTVRVQREPFEAKGARAEAFAPGTRFAKERLWHIEIAFAEAVCGPLILGDGRYLGLGLMAPVKDAWRDMVVFSLPADACVAVADRGDLLRAVRRALMALSRDNKGNVPPLFAGHEPDGAPAKSGRHRHVFLACTDSDGDGRIERLIVAAPWACDRSALPGWGEHAEFDRVVASLKAVRAGRLGVIPLRISSADQRLNGPARTWESHTDYRPARHAGRGKDPAAALLRDVAAECERHGLPKPAVELLDLSVGPKDGVAARLRLCFAVAVAGPILLGRDSHKGGGLFEATMR
jgi:CRISPR-associated protein Csb2